MSVTSGFFNSVNHDRMYNAEQMSAIFDGVINDGIFSNIGTAFRVKAGDGLNVTVGIGRCWFNSVWLFNDAELSLELEASELLLNRYDAVIIEIDKSEFVRAGTIKIIKGTPSSEAAPPTMTRRAALNQYPLAYIYREANTSTVTDSVIQNRVGTSDAPYVTGILQVQNIDNIVAQWRSQWNDWTAETKNEFETWFSSIKDLLDEDVAAKLAADVVDLKTITAELQEEAESERPVTTGGTGASTPLGARTNLGVRSNENLLNNWWFLDGVINQREVTSWSSGYGIDRWSCAYCTASISSDGIMLKNSSARESYIFQRLEGSHPAGIDRTLSVKINGVVYSGTGSGIFNVWDSPDEAPRKKVATFYTSANGNPAYVSIICQAGDTVSGIQAVKLEYGTVSTLDGDPAPDRGIELLKCQRFYQRIQPGLDGIVAIAHAYFDKNAVGVVKFSVPMRAKPSVLRRLGAFKTHVGAKSYPLPSAYFTADGVDTCRVYAGLPTGATYAVDSAVPIEAGEETSGYELIADL